MVQQKVSNRKKRRFLIEFETADTTSTGFTHNLSPTGIFVRSIRTVKPGTALTARLYLPNGQKLPLRGSVVRTFRAPSVLSHILPSGFGLRLLEIPPAYLQFLATL